MMYCYRERSGIYEQPFGNIIFKDMLMSISSFGRIARDVCVDMSTDWAWRQKASV